MSVQTDTGAGVPEWDLGDRLRKALRAAGVSVQAMAEELDCTRQTVGAYMSGRVTPKVPVLRVWAMRCGVPYEWLATGKIADSDGPERPGGQVIDASGCFSQTASDGTRPQRSVLDELAARRRPHPFHEALPERVPA